MSIIPALALVLIIEGIVSFFPNKWQLFTSDKLTAQQSTASNWRNPGNSATAVLFQLS